MSKDCFIHGCPNNAKFMIEWYSLNQYRENPIIADERPVCDDFLHLVRASQHDRYGGYPDGIVDIETLDIEHPGLLEKVKSAIDNPNLLDRQKRFSFMLV